MRNRRGGAPRGVRGVALGRARWLELVMVPTIPLAIAGPESVATISRERRLQGGVASPDVKYTEESRACQVHERRVGLNARRITRRGARGDACSGIARRIGFCIAREVLRLCVVGCACVRGSGCLSRWSCISLLTTIGELRRFVTLGWNRSEAFHARFSRGRPPLMFDSESCGAIPYRVAASAGHRSRIGP